MKFSLGLIFAFHLATSVMALPSTTPESGRDEIARLAGQDGGSIVYYGASKSDRSPVSIDNSFCLFNCKPQCDATATPSCDKSNGADNEACENLVVNLQAHGDVEVPGSPRQACYLRGDKKCCVTWGTEVKESNGRKLTNQDLYTNAKRITTTCSQNGISGKMANIKLLDTCTEFCVSNRESHC